MSLCTEKCLKIWIGELPSKWGRIASLCGNNRGYKYKIGGKYQCPILIFIKNKIRPTAQLQESQVHLKKPKNTNLVLKGLLCLLKGASFLLLPPRNKEEFDSFITCRKVRLKMDGVKCFRYPNTFRYKKTILFVWKDLFLLNSPVLLAWMSEYLLVWKVTFNNDMHFEGWNRK